MLFQVFVYQYWIGKYQLAVIIF